MKQPASIAGKYSEHDNYSFMHKLLSNTKIFYNEISRYTVHTVRALKNDANIWNIFPTRVCSANQNATPKVFRHQEVSSEEVEGFSQRELALDVHEFPKSGAEHHLRIFRRFVCRRSD